MGTVIRYGDVAMTRAGQERFDPGAFGDVARLDTVLTWQHDGNTPLARTGGVGDSRCLRRIYGGSIYGGGTLRAFACCGVRDTGHGEDRRRYSVGPLRHRKGRDRTRGVRPFAVRGGFQRLSQSRVGGPILRPRSWNSAAMCSAPYSPPSASLRTYSSPATEGASVKPSGASSMRACPRWPASLPRRWPGLSILPGWNST